MSLSAENLEDILLYADGECDAAGRERALALLEANEEARAVLASVSALGEFVRDASNDAVARVGSARIDGVADAVMARLERETEVARPTELERARARRAAQLKVAAIATAVTALAAGFALFARPHESERGLATVETTTLPPPNGASPNTTSPNGGPPATAALASNEPGANGANGDVGGVDVDSVEAPGTGVSVIYVPAVTSANANASSVVIWINDEPAPGGP